MSALVVQHNILAMNADRMLGINTKKQAKSTEKLSSGYRINRAADDAAGLTISEKMRRQIRGLDRASTNAEDGTSAVQTAEGALTEVHSMLQRMNELAVQAANGTNSQSDREAIQDEVDQLLTEIDRVSETTKFNEIYLLKGDSGATKTVNLEAHDAGLAGQLVDYGDGTAVFTMDWLDVGDTVTIAGVDYTIYEDDILSPGGLTLLEGNKATGFGTVTVTTTAIDCYFKSGDVVVSGSYTGALDQTLVYTDGTETTGDGNFITAGWYTDASLNKAKGTDGRTSDLVLGDRTGLDINIDATLTNGDWIETTAAVRTYTGFADEEEMLAAVRSGKTIYKGDAGTLAEEGTDYTYEGTVEPGENGITISEAYQKAYDALLQANRIGDTNGSAGVEAGEDAGSVLTLLNNHQATDFGTVTPANVSPHFANNNITVSGHYTGKTDQDLMYTDGTQTSAGDEVIAAGWYTKASLEDALADANGGGAAAALLVVGDTSGLKINIEGTLTNGDTISITAEKYNPFADEDAMKAALEDGENIYLGDADTRAVRGTDYTWTANAANVFTITVGSTTVADTLRFNVHAGADADMTNKIGVDIETINTAYLGIADLNVADDTGIAATYAIDAIADAIAKVSEQRSTLGAIQNRLEHTIANVDNVVENTTSAESRIRDTDMAEEMVEYSKNNILAQAGQAMLAQANTSTQGVLSLLG